MINHLSSDRNASMKPRQEKYKSYWEWLKENSSSKKTRRYVLINNRLRFIPKSLLLGTTLLFMITTAIFMTLFINCSSTNKISKDFWSQMTEAFFWCIDTSNCITDYFLGNNKWDVCSIYKQKTDADFDKYRAYFWIKRWLKYEFVWQNNKFLK